MVLNHEQISTTLSQLHNVLDEQREILADAETVICTNLAAVWECEAQKAYNDAFLSVKDRVLSQINSLIELFSTALAQSHEGLNLVDIDLSNMNSSAI